MKLDVTSPSSIRTTPATPGRPEPVSESEFQAALERALNDAKSPVRVDRINSGDLIYKRNGATNRFRGAREGTGDLVGYVLGDGWHLEVELKAKRGRAGEAQKARARAAEAAGWIYVRVMARGSVGESVDQAVVAVLAAIRARRAR